MVEFDLRFGSLILRTLLAAIGIVFSGIAFFAAYRRYRDVKSRGWTKSDPRRLLRAGHLRRTGGRFLLFLMVLLIGYGRILHTDLFLSAGYLVGVVAVGLMLINEVLDFFEGARLNSPESREAARAHAESMQEGICIGQKEGYVQGVLDSHEGMPVDDLAK